MSWTTGYYNEALMNQHGLHGKNKDGFWWEHDGKRYYFEDENRRRWFARYTVKGEDQRVTPIKTEKARGYRWDPIER